MLGDSVVLQSKCSVDAPEMSKTVEDSSRTIVPFPPVLSSGTFHPSFVRSTLSPSDSIKFCSKTSFLPFFHKNFLKSNGHPSRYAIGKKTNVVEYEETKGLVSRTCFNQDFGHQSVDIHLHPE